MATNKLIFGLVVLAVLFIAPVYASAQVGYGGGGGGGGGGIIESLTGDVNNDSRIDILDFNTLLFNWGYEGFGVSVDLNRDGIVDILDFNMLIANWR